MTWEEVQERYNVAARIIEEECIDDIRALRAYKKYIIAHLDQKELHEDLNLINNYK